MRHLCLTIFALSAAIAAASAPASADEPPATMLLIDGSGSMWAPIGSDKRAKIDIVRDILSPAIASASQSKIGLASFGHRRTGDCSDVEVFTPPIADHTGIVGVVDKLNPKGKGPIAEALRQTARAIGTTRPANILAITDGADNCRQDACEAAAEIAKTMPGVAIHLVSLAVEPEELPRLGCVAKLTGGRLFDVRDAQSIAPALDEAIKTALLSPDVGAPSLSENAGAGSAAVNPPSPPGAPGANLRLTANLASGGAILTQPLHWRIAKQGGETIREGDAPDLAMTVEPGSYEIDTSLGQARAHHKVEVEAGKLSAVTLPLNAARLRIHATSAKDGAVSPQMQMSIAREAQDKSRSEIIWLSSSAHSEIILPPGTYKLNGMDGLVHQQKQVALAAGAANDIDLGLNSGRLELTASAKEDGPPIQSVTFIVSEDDPDSPAGRRELMRTSAPIAEISLPPGTYYISALTNDSETRQRIALRQGEVLKRTLVVPLGRLKLSALVSGQPAGAASGLTYRVISLDGEPHEVTRTNAAQSDLQLKSGRYRIDAKLGAFNVKNSQDIAIETGKTAELTFKLEAGEVSLKPPQGATLIPGEVFWEIRDLGGKPVWNTTVADPSAMLAPGKYTARMETRDKRIEAAFDLKPGERRTLQLGPN